MSEAAKNLLLKALDYYRQNPKVPAGVNHYEISQDDRFLLIPELENNNYITNVRYSSSSPKLYVGFDFTSKGLGFK